MIDGCAALRRSRQTVFGIIVHEKADRSAVHAIDRLRRLHGHVQGLQHQAVAAERHDDVGLVERAVAIEGRELLQRLVGFLRAGRQEGDRLRSRHWRHDRHAHFPQSAQALDELARRLFAAVSRGAQS